MPDYATENTSSKAKTNYSSPKPSLDHFLTSPAEHFGTGSEVPLLLESGRVGRLT